MKVPLLDLQAQYATLREELNRAVLDVMESQHFILGPEVKTCEERIACYSQSPHGVGVSSGTDALLIALMSEGIGPGDEVITSPFTFFATAGCIARVGARPVFADIDPVTFNLDPAAAAARVTPRTKALMPVHLYGQMTDMDPLLALAAERGLTVIEDAAQALGAEYKGRRAGSLGHYGCFSFFPSKNLGAAGDAGLVVTGDPARYERLLRLRSHGSKPKYYHQLVGGNFRLDTIQAAVVNVKLPHLDGWTAARQAHAQRYGELFTRMGLVERGLVTLPAVRTNRHIFNQYVIRAANRDALLAHLKASHIGTEVYYPLPLHLQVCFASLGYREGDFPESERAARETLALPIAPEVTDEQARYVVGSIAHFYEAGTHRRQGGQGQGTGEAGTQP